MKPRPILGWTAAALATYVAVFVLPYRFPLQEPVLSDTWVAGANNQVAAIALALLSAAITLLLWRRTPTQEVRPSDKPTIPIAALAVAMVLSIVWTATLGHAVHAAGLYWGDEGYFLNQLQTHLTFPSQPFEFAYGPALYLWPEAFIKTLGIAAPTAYLISLAVLQAIGLGLLFYVVNALPMRRSLKLCAFILFAIGTLNSLLGLNYSLFRFVLPFAAVVLLTRRKTWAWAALLAAIGEIVMLAVSPELGLAFAGAAMAIGLHRSLTRDRIWIYAALTPLLGAAVFVTIAGPTYFSTLRSMAKGGYNLLLTPAPHILVLLVAAVVLAPLAVARTLRAGNDLTLGLYVAALGFLPAALGRCDPIHVFFNGMGFFLLAFVALDVVSVACTRIALTVATILFAITQLTNIPLYRERLALILHPASQRKPLGFDESRLLSAIHGAQISAPMLAPQPVLEDLTRTGQYLPGFYCGWVGVWDAAAEQRKIADMRRAPFALIGLSDPVVGNSAAERRIERWMHFGFATHSPRPPYLRGALLAEEFNQHWLPLERYGDYVLFEKR